MLGVCMALIDDEKDKKMFAVVKNEEGGFNIICYVL